MPLPLHREYLEHPCATCGEPIVGTPWPTHKGACRREFRLRRNRETFAERTAEYEANHRCTRCGAPALKDRTRCKYCATAQAIHKAKNVQRQQDGRDRQARAVHAAEIRAERREVALLDDLNRKELRKTQALARATEKTPKTLPKTPVLEGIVER